MSLVPVAITVQLGLPESRIALRHISKPTAFVLMPETAMDKNGHAPA
jgi:hypothetical protein